jgi:hypothetical protein
VVVEGEASPDPYIHLFPPLISLFHRRKNGRVARRAAYWASSPCQTFSDMSSGKLASGNALTRILLGISRMGSKKNRILPALLLQMFLNPRHQVKVAVARKQEQRFHDGYPISSLEGLRLLLPFLFDISAGTFDLD